MSSTKTGFVDSLLQAAKGNPLAAALIGGGALWLLTGNEAIKVAAKSAAGMTSPVVDAGASAVRSAKTVFERSPPTAPEMDHPSFDMGGAAREAAGKASDAVSEAMDGVRVRIGEGVTAAQDRLGSLTDALPGRQSFEKAQSALADALEKQPLLLGAVGLVVGATVAGAFRPSALENELVGPYSN